MPRWPSIPDWRKRADEWPKFDTRQEELAVLKFSPFGQSLLLVVLLFAALYPQAPLYTDNQNTKFPHGAASAS